MLAAPLRRPGPDRRRGGGSPFERPWVVWLLVLAGLVGAASWSDLLAVSRDLRLPDTDDAMRLVEVRDTPRRPALVRPRPAPPCRRAADALVALRRCADRGLILLARSLAGPVRAEGIAAVLWPLLLLALYAAILYRGVRTASAGAPEPSRSFAGTQAVFVTSLFAPGRIDHHNVQICAILPLVLLLAPAVPDRGDGALAGLLAAFLAGGRARGAAVHRRGRPRPRRVLAARRARRAPALPRLRPRPRPRRPPPLPRPDRSLPLDRDRLRRALAALALARGRRRRHGRLGRPWCRTNAGGACGSGCSPPAAPSRSGASSFCSPCAAGPFTGMPTSCGRNGS